MVNCNCNVILKDIENIYERERENRKSAFEDGGYWATMVSGDTIKYIDDYLKDNKIKKCRCQDYIKLSKVVDLVEGYKKAMKTKMVRNSEIAIRCVKDNTFVLIDCALYGKPHPLEELAKKLEEKYKK